ncbi:uncharacterized protein LOC141686605 [Apium graveolens]|uniref:uncharacterized protein LOC141686605 n=1 Tax=Apium graveolens TaxID=4045 RepID=UPI003D7A1FA8
MEDKSASTAMVIHSGPKNQNFNGERKRKRFGLFKTAMGMLGGRPSEKPKATKQITAATTNDNLNSDENWKMVVGSMRPLHSQDLRSPPPQIPRPAKTFSIESTSSDDDYFGASPALSTTSWGTTSYGSSSSLQELAESGRMRQSESTNSLSKMSMENMSRYASALNLGDLDADEEADEDVEDDSNNLLLEICEADDMIDSKADEFIARFYDQMKGQQ